MNKTSETTLEQTTLDWFASLDWQTAFGPDISPDGPNCERDDYDQVVLTGRLQSALESINPEIPAESIEEAVRKIIRTESPGLIENNRRFHHMLTDGVDVSYLDNGREVYDKVWLLELENIENNDWVVVNQFTVVQDQRNRRSIRLKGYDFLRPWLSWPYVRKTGNVFWVKLRAKKWG